MAMDNVPKIFVLISYCHELLDLSHQFLHDASVVDNCSSELFTYSEYLTNVKADTEQVTSSGNVSDSYSEGSEFEAQPI
jgi:hypothetical protein